jgi:hypothetical protein
VTYSDQGEPTEHPSALTPAGVVDSYGSAFGALRGRNKWRRAGAFIIALVIFGPLLVVVIGFAMILIRAL